eukprot:Opistho-1_new@68104
MGQAPQRKQHEGPEPEQRGAGFQRRAVEHEVAVALRHEGQDVRLAAAAAQLLAYLPAQVHRKLGMGRGHGFVLADQAAQLFGNRHHPRFQRGVGHARRGQAILRTHRAGEQACDEQQHGAHGSAFQLPDQRQQPGLQHLARELAGVLEADHAVAVDHIGFRHAVHAEVQAHAAVGVGQRGLVGVAVARQPAQRKVAAVLVVQADQRHLAGFRKIHQQRVFGLAGHAPRGPHVEHPDLPAQLGGAERALGRGQRGQAEDGRWPAHQGRRHFARVQLQAGTKQGHEHHEHRERPQETQARSFHGCTFCATSGASPGAVAWPASRWRVRTAR